jgi:hypothetical protein
MADTSGEHSTRLAVLELFRRRIVRGTAIGLAAILVFTLVAAPFAAETQPAAKVYRISLLGEQASDPSEARLWQVFRLESSWLGGSWSHIPAMEREAGR